MPSILQQSDFGPLKLRYRKSLRDRIDELNDALVSRLRDRRVRRAGAAALIALLIGGGIYAYYALRPVPVPNYLIDDLDDVLDYTFVTDAFNKLPLDERLRLLKDLISRLKGMDSGDSALMAAFAAGLSGKAIEQVRKNVEILAVDLWDDFARRYRDVPKGDRTAFLDDSFIQFTEMMQEVSGFTDRRTPNERLAEAKKQAQRDTQRPANARPMEAERIGGFMEFMAGRGAAVSTPEQRGRMAKFSRDMVRHLRNQDIDSGRPREPGAAPTPPPAPPGGPAGPAGPANPAGPQPPEEQDDQKDGKKDGQKDGKKDGKKDGQKDKPATPAGPASSPPGGG